VPASKLRNVHIGGFHFSIVWLRPAGQVTPHMPRE
jgi:hypothetical protein